jgi:sugar phosphate isomerase/epimerase
MARIGVQASTVRQSFAESGTFETLRRLDEIGYHTVEISQVPMSPDNVSEMRRAREQLGIEIAALSAVLDGSPVPGFESLRNDYDKIVLDCRAVETSILRIGMLPLDALGDIDGLVEFATTANQFAVRLRDEGVDLYYHNHHLEFQKVGGRYVLDIIAESAPDVGLELDVHWIHRGGLDPVSVLRNYSGRARLVHLKDYRIAALPPAALESMRGGDVAAFMRDFLGVVQFAEVGEGNLDWEPVIEQALASGAEYLLVEQDDTYGRDPFESLVISRANLVAMGYGDLF